MSPAEPSQQFPRLPLFSAALLIGTALVLVATVRLTGVGQSHTPDAPTIAERDLRFLDRADGGVNVIDARSGELVSSVEGQQGFLRGTLRGLARERRRSGISSEAPFRLLARADGRLTLEDPATGRRIDLESFGPTNESTFAALLGSEVRQLPDPMANR
jgi:putative photosynthetic complex assembly protein